MTMIGDTMKTPELSEGDKRNVGLRYTNFDDR